MTEASDYGSAFRETIRQDRVPPDRLALLASLTHYGVGCAVPLLLRHGENYSARGTGTLFRAGGKSFLITAAHVVREEGETITSKLLIPDRARRTAFRLSVDEFAETSEGSRYDPDFAVLRLDEELAERLRTEGELTFLTLADVVVRDTTLADIVMVCGYPGAFFPPSPTLGPLRPLVLVTKGSTRTPPSLPFELQPGVHVLIELGELGFTLGPDAHLSPVPLPPLYGISGCPVFVSGIAQEDRQRLCDGGVFSPDAGLKLGGLEIGVFSDSGLIRVTTWTTVASLIVHRWPELNDEFERAKVWLE